MRPVGTVHNQRTELTDDGWGQRPQARPNRIGTTVCELMAVRPGGVIEVTAKPHTGCAKFTRRFGLASHRWINGTVGRAERLRGVCAIVVEPGTVRRGDTIRKL